MPKVGAHVSAAVSLEKAFDKAITIEAECIQFFVSPPQQWLQTKHDEAEIERFRNKQKETGIDPIFIHATYLVNLGAADTQHLEKSIAWLKYGLSMAEKLGITGVIVHTGSHKGVGFENILPQVVEALKRILISDYFSSESEKLPYLILETSAGGGGSIGRSFYELGQILKTINNPRLRVCLDTQHVFAAGYDLRTPLVINDVIQEFDEEIGLINLIAIHANDSKTEHKSQKDRHENISEGLIGEEGFTYFINHPKLKDIPFILEVPGFSNSGPDKENVQKLKSLILTTDD